MKRMIIAIFLICFGTMQASEERPGFLNTIRGLFNRSKPQFSRDYAQQAPEQASVTAPKEKPLTAEAAIRVSRENRRAQQQAQKERTDQKKRAALAAKQKAASEGGPPASYTSMPNSKVNYPGWFGGSGEAAEREAGVADRELSLARELRMNRAEQAAAEQRRLGAFTPAWFGRSGEDAEHEADVAKREYLLGEELKMNGAAQTAEEERRRLEISKFATPGWAEGLPLKEEQAARSEEDARRQHLERIEQERLAAQERVEQELRARQLAADQELAEAEARRALREIEALEIEKRKQMAREAHEANIRALEIQAAQEAEKQRRVDAIARKEAEILRGIEAEKEAKVYERELHLGEELKENQRVAREALERKEMERQRALEEAARIAEEERIRAQQEKEAIQREIEGEQEEIEVLAGGYEAKKEAAMIALFEKELRIMDAMTPEERAAEEARIQKEWPAWVWPLHDTWWQRQIEQERERRDREREERDKAWAVAEQERLNQKRIISEKENEAVYADIAKREEDLGIELKKRRLDEEAAYNAYQQEKQQAVDAYNAYHQEHFGLSPEDIASTGRAGESVPSEQLSISMKEVPVPSGIRNNIIATFKNYGGTWVANQALWLLNAGRQNYEKLSPWARNEYNEFVYHASQSSARAGAEVRRLFNDFFVAYIKEIPGAAASLKNYLATTRPGRAASSTGNFIGRQWNNAVDLTGQFAGYLNEELEDRAKRIEKERAERERRGYPEE